MFAFFLLGVCWTVAGVLAYGISFATAQREWPEIAERDYYADMARSAAVALLGPIALLAALLVNYQMGIRPHGLKFR